MELELEASGGGGRVVSLSSDSPEADLGCGDLAVPRADRTVSRRHVSLRLVGGGGEPPRVAFEVVGRNPVVFHPSFGAEKVYRRGETGELTAGDGLSLSLKAPSFWTVRRTGAEGDVAEVDTAVLDAVARREKRTRERKEKEREMRAMQEAMEVAEEEQETAVGAGDEEVDEELEDLKIDMTNIDPVQEFGFLSMGHEFDKYPKGRIRPPKDWSWFLEEIKKGSDDDDDDVSNTGRKSRSGGGANKKKKKRGDDEDEEWTDESEDGKDSLQGGPSVKRPKKYVTRSKEAKKPRKERSKTENEDAAVDDDEAEEEDEEDETLGGFIVKEDDEPVEELSEEEEEDEFDDEDEDD